MSKEKPFPGYIEMYQEIERLKKESYQKSLKIENLKIDLEQAVKYMKDNDDICCDLMEKKNKKFSDFYYDVLEAYGWDMTEPSVNAPTPNDLCSLIAEQFEMLKTANDNYDQLKAETKLYGTTIGKQSESMYNQSIEITRLNSELTGLKKQICDLFDIGYKDDSPIDSLRLLDWLNDISQQVKNLNLDRKELHQVKRLIYLLMYSLKKEYKFTNEFGKNLESDLSLLSLIISGIQMNEAALTGEVKEMQARLDTMPSYREYADEFQKIGDILGFTGKFAVDFGYKQIKDQIKYLNDIIEEDSAKDYDFEQLEAERDRYLKDRGNLIYYVGIMNREIKDMEQ